MKNYTLHVARVELEGAGPIIVVQLPWDEFSHQMGCDEYESVIAPTLNAAICVSLSPQGEWRCRGTWAHLWPRILSNTKAEELGWHTMQVTAQTDPKEEIAKLIAAGFR